MSGTLTLPWQDQLPAQLSAEPILAAVDAFRGSIFDFDRLETITAAAFAHGWRDLSAELSARGLQPGDRLVMAVGNGPLFPAALAAVLAQGGTPLLLHAETPMAEVKRVALRIGARFLLCDGLDEASLQAAGCTPHTIGEAWTRTVWAQVDSSDPLFQEPQYALPGVPLHPTSGSTGQPKVAARPGVCAIEEARHYVQTVGIDEADTLLVIPPMSHAYAYGMCVMVPLLTGASLVAMRRFSPHLVQQAFHDHKITIFPASPAMLDMLLFAVPDGLDHVPRCVLSAGSPLPERTAHQFQRKLSVAVRPLYGTTETGGITVAAAAEGVAGGCVGRPMDGVSVELRPPAHGPHWDDGVGKVHIRSSSMMAGYLGQGQLDTSALVDGWFATGDLGRCDASGAIHLVGRESDVINVCGMKVVPQEVEEIIAALPGVREVKVYRGQRRDGAQFVKAAIVAAGLAPARIRAHCEASLVYYKRPETITLLPALPRSPTGKILRERLP